MRQLILIAHNLRSTHNVGSLLRTADGLGVSEVWLTGYTPHPIYAGDQRLPHEADKSNRQIRKTALGAEKFMTWYYEPSIESAVKAMTQRNFSIVALEQTATAVSLPKYSPGPLTALIVGRETEGLEPEVLALCDEVVCIPMLGQKESFNVVQASAMALYHMRYKI
jgi:23S rRNA (guanosine2251-2'-O)-methyltransferase